MMIELKKEMNWKILERNRLKRKDLERLRVADMREVRKELLKKRKELAILKNNG